MHNLEGNRQKEGYLLIDLFFHLKNPSIYYYQYFIINQHCWLDPHPTIITLPCVNIVKLKLMPLYGINIMVTTMSQILSIINSDYGILYLTELNISNYSQNIFKIA